MPAANSIPPTLPPSVEEAYRRKCIQLKQRTSEVEEANDAARVRLTRLKRQVEKMRLERAFLLEQLAKRTSTNVEDSDGSPSPPPTQPKEKPLRIKRGHRKPSILANTEAPPSANATFISQNPQTLSPSSDTFSTQQHQSQQTVGRTNGSAAINGKGAAGGLPARPQKPPTAFELFCAEARSHLDERAKDSRQGPGGEEELARVWKEELAEDQRTGYEAKREMELARYEKAKADYEIALSKEEAALAAKEGADVDDEEAVRQENGVAAAAGRDDAPRATQDEDVEMTNYDTDQETQAERAGD
ncbi:hypothetical protein P8C59_004654 [Phyllachora maydis]|uniref:HMG box domain-containing protein n=1 Tax=Phyllachora maydis TaxID=1825666 RepID=A0AAD9I2S3_9PEZI|nr:hypothetical protein P8C59_004654 [Phyllachora maydis]